MAGPTIPQGKTVWSEIGFRLGTKDPKKIATALKSLREQNKGVNLDKVRANKTQIKGLDTLPGRVDVRA